MLAKISKENIHATWCPQVNREYDVTVKEQIKEVNREYDVTTEEKIQPGW